MSDNNNPFSTDSATSTNVFNGADHTNPFQALEQATEAQSPFAGLAAEAPAGLAESETNRPAKLPEKRIMPEPETAPLPNGNPFEVVSDPNAASPFEMGAFQPDGRRDPSPAPASMPAPLPQQARPEGGAMQPALMQPQYAPQFAPAEPAAAAPAAAVAPAPLQAATEEQFAAREPVAAASTFAAPAEASVATTPTTPTTPSGSMKQLELRAIFGVNHELTRDDIMQRARALPGVRNIAVVTERESQALDVLRTSVSQLGFCDGNVLSFVSSGGNIDFINEGGSTVAVLHEGGYAPGVRETLIIVTRELAQTR